MEIFRKTAKIVNTHYKLLQNYRKNYLTISHRRWDYYKPIFTEPKANTNNNQHNYKKRQNAKSCHFRDSES